MMDEGTWIKAQHDEIKLGDTVRVTSKDGPQTTIVEGKVTQMNPESYDGKSWCVEDFESFYANEFISSVHGSPSVLEKFVPPFEWPTKLGAVVTGKDDDKVLQIVLVEEDPGDPEYALWWTRDWGIINKYDIGELEDLTVVSEGVTVEA